MRPAVALLAADCLATAAQLRVRVQAGEELDETAQADVRKARAALRRTLRAASVS